MNGLVGRHRSCAQIALDTFVGLSVASWGLAVLLPAHGPPTAVRAVIAATDLVIGALFVVRAPAHAEGSRGAIMSALPSVIAGGLALETAPEDRWPLACAIAFVVGAAAGIVAMLSLGRSFAIFPARRHIVARGPYRFVRHPIYGCELMMVVAAGAARSWWSGLALGILLLVVLVPRIRAEESLLARDPAWSTYARGVRWRLLPGVY